MATTNLFDLLGDDENDDPNQLLQKLPPPPKKAPAPAQSAAATQPAKLPSKPLPPAQAGETMTTLLSDKCTKLLYEQYKTRLFVATASTKWQCCSKVTHSSNGCSNTGFWPKT
ncbi:RGG repeats nuclear RNA binding protein A-like isoform X5 [Camellia sinensis]|uniref:RGG repeats nuclear RNA binding protein A-like isoform X5 n=1 Tax=Camellia sinensis TaxID=4442 RepID=UPI001035925A|nr:RGG repeats nuclear RNA binding protein A-like isoform X5 [Camellia sinensis]